MPAGIHLPPAEEVSALPVRMVPTHRQTLTSVEQAEQAAGRPQQQRRGPGAMAGCTAQAVVAAEHRPMDLTPAPGATALPGLF
jgi:hypothetical protein